MHGIPRDQAKLHMVTSLNDVGRKCIHSKPRDEHILRCITTRLSQVGIQCIHPMDVCSEMNTTTLQEGSVCSAALDPLRTL